MESRDLNRDGDLEDRVLLRHLLGTNTAGLVGTLNDVQGPAIFTDEDRWVAFQSDEAMAKRDWNGDGDTMDMVWMYSREALLPVRAIAP